MKRLLHVLLLISLITSILFTKGYDISKGRYHPEVTAFGNSGIAGYSIPNAIQLNPANIAHSNGWNNYWYGTKFENALMHNDFTTSFQYYGLGVGISYIYQNLGNIPKTGFISGRIRQNGDFSENITQTQLHLAGKLTNLLFLKELDLGTTIGFQKYSFSNDQDLFIRFGSVVALDLLPNMYFGLLLNDPSEENIINYGIQYREPTYKVFIDKGDKGYSFGGEYLLNSNLAIRAGKDKDFISVGLGFLYEKLYLFKPEAMGLRFDYTLQVPAEKYPFEPQHLFGITIREQDKLPSPYLYEYPAFTNKKTADVVGWSLQNTNVQVYYKDILIDIVKTNRNGYWEATLPLMQEANDFYFKAIQKGPRKESNPSKRYRIVVDQKSPDFKFRAYVFGELVTIDIYPDEVLSRPPYINETKKSAYFNKNKYTLETELKNISNGFITTLYDNAQNKSIIAIDNPFIKVSSPLQKMLVTYKDKYQFIGSAGIYHQLSVKNFKNNFEQEIPLTGKTITIFKPIIPVELGVNKIEFTDKVEKGTVFYKYLIYRLFNYKDINDRDADILATCYVLPRTDLFEPLKRVREFELISWLAGLIRITDIFSAKDIKLDEAYNFALSSRWIRTRDDMRFVSRGETIDILSRALGYNLYNTSKDSKYFENITQNHPYIKAINYFVEKGYLDVSGRFYDQEVFINRKELMDWLKKSPQFLKLKNELKEY